MAASAMRVREGVRRRSLVVLKGSDSANGSLRRPEFVCIVVSALGFRGSATLARFKPFILLVRRGAV